MTVLPYNKKSESEKRQLIEIVLNNIPHVALQNMRLESIHGEQLTLRLPYRDELVGNPDTGAIHSGTLTVLLDTTLGIATLCNDQFPPSLTPTLDLRIDHLGVAPAGKDILACARAYKITSRVIFVEGFAYYDSPDKPVAKATGSFIHMKEVDLAKNFRKSRGAIAE